MEHTPGHGLESKGTPGFNLVSLILSGRFPVPLCFPWYHYTTGKSPNVSTLSGPGFWRLIFSARLFPGHKIRYQLPGALIFQQGFQGVVVVVENGGSA